MHKISWTGPRLFVIVGKNDNPIYEHSFVNSKESQYMGQFILHASLDLVDEMQWKQQQTFIKTVCVCVCVELLFGGVRVFFCVLTLCVRVFVD